MCDKCDELDEKIAHARRIAQSILDAETVERIATLIEDYEAQKKLLHPEQ